MDAIIETRVKALSDQMVAVGNHIDATVKWRKPPMNHV